MKAGALALLGIAIASLAMASPPDRGGVMFGPDSSMVLYWAHPDINRYEQGYDNNSETSWFIAGEEPVTCAVAVNFPMPFGACLESIRAKMSLTDHCVGHPGDPFSPFRVAVHEAGVDGGPREPPLYAGSGRSCDGEPCLDDWFDRPLRLSRMTSGSHWQVFQWMDSTPAEPQIIARIRRADDPSALIGVGDGNGLIWDSLYYIPVFRQRLLGIFPLDTAVAVGWRRPMPAENPPDSFLVVGFLGDTVAAEIVRVNTDTLMCHFGRADFDSISIYSCYDGLVDDSACTVTLEKSKSPPIMADIVFPDSKMNSPAALHIINLLSDPIFLRLTYDPRIIAFDADTVLLAGHETKIIGGAITEPPDDTTDVMIVLSDDEGRYYPFVVRSTWPQSGQTDIAGDGEENASAYSHPAVAIYPNPSLRTVTIADENFRAVREIAVYNVIGQKIVDISPPFRARMTWDGCDREGKAAPPGIYFVRVSYDDAVVTKAVLLMR